MELTKIEYSLFTENYGVCNSKSGYEMFYGNAYIPKIDILMKLISLDIIANKNQQP